MELNNVLEFLENRTILITGVTGFLAKILLEKILRVQPNVNKLYLLVRASDDKSALQRFNTEIIAKDLFKVLKDKCGQNFNSLISEKITVIAGDLIFENLGINNSNLLETMWKEVDVVINVAATTNFDERYDYSLKLNTMGAKHVLDFAKKCDKLKMLLHVSTAYVAGERSGLILETPYKLGETLNGTSETLNIDVEMKITDDKLKKLKAQNTSPEIITSIMKDFGIQRARKYGWPNTYVFTKTMGEMLLGEFKNNVPLVILRPTIITSTYKEPFPGWVEGIRTIDSLAVGYGKGKMKCLLGDPKTIIDLVPADMVINAMIVAMAAHADQANETIYHVGSSLGNPLEYSRIADYGLRYFTMNPWIDKQGKPIIVGNLTVLTTMESFQAYMALRYMLPLKGLQLVNAICCQYFRGTYLELYRKLNFVFRMVELYGPYLFFKGVFDDMNLEKLRRALKENSMDDDMFYFDPKIIDWDDYFLKTHLPGAVKYIFK